MTNDEIIKLKQENERLRRAIDELSILNDIATAINTTMTVEQLIDLIVRKCINLLKVEQAVVMLLDETKIDDPFQTMIRRADRTSRIMPIKLDTQLTGWMLKHEKPLVINDFAKDDRFQKVVDDFFPIRSLLSVPLITQNRMIGQLTVFNKALTSVFTSDDERLLSIIATQSAQVIENARLQEEEHNLQLITKDFEVAREIQVNLLPKENPQFPGFDIAGKSIPAKFVGGDCFDFISVNDNRLAVSLGDVSGKGLSAALLMANLQASIRAQTLINSMPKKCLEKCNRLLYDSTDSEKYATHFYAILDNRKNQICYANAGHNRPILFGKNKPPIQLETAGLMLSIFKDHEYEQSEVCLDPGDLLLIYSDGITEAMTVQDEEYGEQRLTQFVETVKYKSAHEVIDLILNDVKSFVKGHPQSDDMTMIVIKNVN
ncbi:SpoIIE family protein phosphatase [candidate division KSB1 bacterium]|nr:SpoIIE family protein phosphatase [candidate division KSB1 bacterium]